MLKIGRGTAIIAADAEKHTFSECVMLIFGGQSTRSSWTQAIYAIFQVKNPSTLTVPVKQYDT